MTTGMYKKGMVLAIIGLFIGAGVVPSISGDVEDGEGDYTIIKEAIEFLQRDAIKNELQINNYHLKEGKYYERQNYPEYTEKMYDEINEISNIDGLGMIDPVWLSSSGGEKYSDIKIYNGDLYVSGFHFFNFTRSYPIICKYNIENGELIWKTNFTLFPNSLAYDIEVSEDGVFIVGTDYTEPISFLCKYDFDGKYIWHKIIAEESLAFYSLTIHDDHIYLCGSDHLEARISKYDFNSNLIWDKIYPINGTYLNNLADIIIHNGFIYCSGQSRSDQLAQNVLVIKCSLEGELIWHEEWGGKNAELSSGLYIVDSIIYVIGFGQGDSHWNFFSFILKYDTDGTVITYTKSDEPFSFIDIVVYNDNIFITGNSGYNSVLFRFDLDLNLISYLNGLSLCGRDIEIYNDFLYGCEWGYVYKYDPNIILENTRPDKPLTPSGPTSGKTGNYYDYSTNCIDPDGDLLCYHFSWGDYNESIYGWVESGELVTEQCHWNNIGDYELKVRTRDEHGYVSEWSDPLTVSMPKNKPINTPFLQFLENHQYLFPLLRHLLGL